MAKNGKKSWWIIDMNSDLRWYVENAPTPEAAIMEYFKECQERKTKGDCLLQVIPANVYFEFEIKLEMAPKFTFKKTHG